MEWKETIVTYLTEKGFSLVGAMCVMLVGVVAAHWIGKFLTRWLAKRQMEPPARMLMTRVAKLLVIALAFLIAVGTLGVQIMPLVAGLSVAGVGVGLAMQGVLGNLISGLVIIFTKPFRVGEYIDIIGEQGVVDTIELFNTVLLHPDRSRVIIPNRKIVGEVLHNYGTIRQLDLAVGVAYDTDLTRALALVREVLSQNSRVLKELTPTVGVIMLGDSSINIAVRPWVAIPDYGMARTEIYEGLVDRFRKSSISIPFPQREIRVLNGNGTHDLRTKQMA